ncbi:MAG: DUF1667 domain-containing protein [Bacilli bacterium]|jgi:CxxC motif-containing protein
MIKKITCIVCPNGCQLEIDELTHQVTGNKCLRGVTFAINEVTNPLRSVSSTVRTNLPEYPVVSVRTNGEIPKDQMLGLIKLLKGVIVDDYLPIGTIIIHNVFGSNVDVITTANMQKGDLCV